MLSIKPTFLLISPLFCYVLILPFITTSPIPSRDDPFAKFVDFLMRNNCSMPNMIDIPFPITDSYPFSYLSTPLQECQSPEALKENNEAHLLCKEAFDVLQNITCNDYSLLPKINSSPLSTNICNDFAAIQKILPKQEEYLSGKLGDAIICKVLCTKKYELLCQTLLWSYDTQSKIKKALDSKIKEEEKESMNNIVPNQNDPNEKLTAEQGEGEQVNLKEANQIANKPSAVPDVESTKKISDGSSSSNSKNQSLPKSPLVEIQKDISSVSSNKDSKIVNSDTISQAAQIITSNKINTYVQEGSQESTLNDSVQLSEQNPEISNKNTHQGENIIETQSKNKDENPVKDINSNTKISSLTVKDTVNQSRGSNTSNVLPVNGNDENNAKSSTIVKLKDKISTPIISETEVDSGMTNVGLQEQTENEVKDEKLTSLKKQENSKENLVSDGVTLETDLNLPSTVLSSYSEKNEDLEHPEVKDPELYNDSENDGDYPKQEYDNGFSSLKKDADIKNSVEDGSSQISSSSSIQISPENFPRQLDASQNFLPARNYLPEQEDSHFFFYFLSIVLILMAGYLIFHNKQKIIALIVEGRHERRRRSHGAGYKKLETK